MTKGSGAMVTNTTGDATQSPDRTPTGTGTQTRQSNTSFTKQKYGEIGTFAKPAQGQHHASSRTFDGGGIGSKRGGSNGAGTSSDS